MKLSIPISRTGISYSRHQHHSEANKLAEYLEKGNIIIPFPTLYESPNTRFTKQIAWMNKFDRLLNQDNVKLIDNIEYG